MNRASRLLPLSVAHLALVALLSVSVFGCTDEGVGDPCIPEDEFVPGFAGFAKEEVNVESRSFQCETRICLVNNFKGRVSCPYGQPDPNQRPMGDDRECQLPDYTENVTVAVPAQLKERSASDAVYCSCRCDGPASSKAPFCECPSGFSCEELVDDLGLGKKELVGSYCVKAGTTVEDPTDLRGGDCQKGNNDCEGRLPF